MTKQYLGYILVSTTRQGDGASLDAQKEAISTYADRNGLNISRWFEETETAAKQGRPVFTEMVKLLHKGKADGVIMHKIDRSARNFRDWATIHELQDQGIAVHFAAESLDFTSRGGRLTADIQAVFAADYIRNLKEEIRKGQVGRLKQGLYPFSAPFGYVDTGKGNPKAIDPVLGQCVRDMFELYATGQYSLPSLEQELADRGYRTQSGHKIYTGKIALILANPFYMGVIQLRNHDELYPGVHEPIVSAELYCKVQTMKTDRTRRKKTKHNHLYRGMFQCRSCSNSMIPEKQKNHVYYRCHTRSCPSNSIRQDDLEWAVLDAMKTLKLCACQKQKNREAFDNGIQTTPKNHDLQINKIDHNLERLMQGYLDGIIDQNTYKERKFAFEFRKAELTKRAQQERSTEEKAVELAKFLEHIESLARTYFFANDAEKRELVSLLFSNMTVADKTVEIPTFDWLEEVLADKPSPSGPAVGVENRRGVPLQVSEIDPYKQPDHWQSIVRIGQLADVIDERNRGANSTMRISVVSAA